MAAQGAVALMQRISRSGMLFAALGVLAVPSISTSGVLGITPAGWVCGAVVAVRVGWVLMYEYVNGGNATCIDIQSCGHYVLLDIVSAGISDDTNAYEWIEWRGMAMDLCVAILLVDMVFWIFDRMLTNAIALCQLLCRGIKSLGGLSNGGRCGLGGSRLGNAGCCACGCEVLPLSVDQVMCALALAMSIWIAAGDFLMQSRSDLDLQVPPDIACASVLEVLVPGMAIALIAASIQCLPVSAGGMAAVFAMILVTAESATAGILALIRLTVHQQGN